jgi:putative mycofactocin binding protein MftB
VSSVSSPTDAVNPANAAYDGSRPWALAPQVALRPEPFGALAYHFGTRRLSFLKSRTLLAVVEGLADHASGDAACAAAGVDTDELPIYRQALARLAGSGMIEPKGGR